MLLTLETLRSENLPILFAFWRKLSAGIPYFFPVSQERWQACMFVDRLDGDLLFKRLETYLAFVAGRLLGFIQFGQPNFAWDERGERFPDPAIGVIRHLYFEPEFSRAGRMLLAQAEPFLEKFPRNHAFFHILGMSCNAHHGKLHESFSHVESLLLENGFHMEHENVYYVLDLEHSSILGQRGSLPSRKQNKAVLEVERITSSSGLERYEARQGDKLIGSAAIRLLEPPASDLQKIAYLSWIGLEEGLQGRGVGAAFLSAIVEHLKARCYHSLHTDTAGTNLKAQRFFTKFGFSNQGKTRSYHKQNNQ